jgi:4-oxalocrotonate tautomerase
MAARAPVTDQDQNNAYRHHPVTREGTTPDNNSVTAEQKASLISGALDILDKPLDSTFVVVGEAPLNNWVWGGASSDRISQEAANIIPSRADIEKDESDRRSASCAHGSSFGAMALRPGHHHSR